MGSSRMMMTTATFLNPLPKVLRKKRHENNVTHCKNVYYYGIFFPSAHNFPWLLFSMTSFPVEVVLSRRILHTRNYIHPKPRTNQHFSQVIRARSQFNSDSFSHLCCSLDLNSCHSDRGEFVSHALNRHKPAPWMTPASRNRSLKRRDPRRRTVGKFLPRPRRLDRWMMRKVNAVRCLSPKPKNAAFAANAKRRRPENEGEIFSTRRKWLCSSLHGITWSIIDTFWSFLPSISVHVRVYY